jgi:predicted HicB family RNase H-like nuclease
VNDTTIEYKGYTALIQYSEEDGCFIGKVIGISDQIVFDAPCLEEIRKTFEADVDNYIQYCRQKGREPNKPVSEIMVPVSPLLYAKASRQAEYDGVPVRMIMEAALQKFVHHA